MIMNTRNSIETHLHLKKMYKQEINIFSPLRKAHALQQKFIKLNIIIKNHY